MTCRAYTKRRSGLTLIELLIVVAIMGVLAMALSYAFAAEVTLQRSQEAQRTSRYRTDSVEQAISRLLTGARLSGAAGNTTTYFQVATNGGVGDLGVDRITLTTTSPGVPMASLNDTTDDFQTQNVSRGPVGGLAEVSIGTSPVGNAGGQTGLFERIQRPSDGDPTQGGTESVLDPDIDQIGFQFWNGQAWVTDWDTTTQTTPRLPAAVQVSYRLKNDNTQTLHMFVVPIPASDATAQNPVTETSGQTTSSTTAGG